MQGRKEGKEQRRAGSIHPLMHSLTHSFIHPVATPDIQFMPCEKHVCSSSRQRPSQDGPRLAGGTAPSGTGVALGSQDGSAPSLRLTDIYGLSGHRDECPFRGY